MGTPAVNKAADSGRLVDDLAKRVSPGRLRELTLDLVRIPSPTGDSEAVTARYAEVVRGLGLEVAVLHDLPGGPSTVARLPGAGGGRALTLDGHLDTIHAPHPPPRLEGERIVGRGAGDMKSGIAAMVEAARVLIESGVRLGGTLTLATHSLHEAPVGHMEGLRALIARGDVFTGAALVAECDSDSLAIRGKGQALFELEATRPGEVLHENVARPQGVPNPLDYVARVAARLLARGEELAAADDPLLGPETFFLGQLHGGDFYNRVPVRAALNGTFRCWPNRTWASVEAEFARLLGDVPRPEGLEASLRLVSNGLGYEVSPEEPLVAALRGAFRRVAGRELPLGGALSVCDVNVIVREAGIPAVAHGTGSTTAHADLEWVDLAGIVRATRVYLATIVGYLGVA
jgi:acetylornithine deacetylase/succinyl-diaminopimelate desuccinylase-like protein